MNKKIIIPLLFIVVIALLGISISGYFLQNKGLTISENAALLVTKSSVSVDSGMVELLHSGTTTKVETNSEIHEGDSLKVAEGGMATIYWQDGSLSRVKGPAEVAVTKMASNENLDTHVDMNIRSGEVWTKVLDMVTEDSSFTSRTKTTVASIRGTEVFQKSSEGEEIVSTYQHGVDVEVAGETKPLLEGQELRMEHGKETIQTRAVDPASWIARARERDKEYIGTLGNDRNKRIAELMEKRVSTLPSDAELKELLDFTTGNIPEKNEKIQNVIDTLSLQIKMSSYNGEYEAAQKKADQLVSLLDIYIPAFEMSDERDTLLKNVLNRMNVQQKILFSDTTADNLIFLRTKMGLAKMTLVGDNAEKASALMQRQLFFVQDLTNKGKNDQALQYFTQLSQFDRINEPAWNSMSEARRIMLKKTAEELGAKVTSMKGISGEFQKRILPTESPVQNVNSNTSVSSPAVERIKDLISRGKILEAKELFKTLTKEERLRLSSEFPVLAGVSSTRDSVSNGNSNTMTTTRVPERITNTNTSIQRNSNTATQTPVTNTNVASSNTNSALVKPALIPPKTIIKTQTNSNTATALPKPTTGVYTPAR